MKLFAIVGLLLIGFNSHALDCNQLATSLSSKTVGYLPDSFGGHGTTKNLGELNLLVELYHDACGAIPKSQALQLAETIIGKKNIQK
jgi:hypothetical protein